jgi:BRCA1-associated protein
MTPEELVIFAGIERESIEFTLRIENPVTLQVSAVFQFVNSSHADLFVSRCSGRRFDKKKPEFAIAAAVLSIKAVSLKDIGQTLSFDESGKVLGLDKFFQVPSCPICLQRIDGTITGFLGFNVCQHRTNCQCVYSWKFISCSVCQLLCKEDSSFLPSLTCSKCDESTCLWACLICGHLGCNRFRNSHAKHHFESSHHRFSVDIFNQYVWDYVGDGYAHRMLFRSSSSEAIVFGNEDLHVEQEDSEESSDLVIVKLESLSFHYTNLLSEQLSKQAEHFSREYAEIERNCYTELSEMRQHLLKVQNEISSMQKEFQELKRLKNESEGLLAKLQHHVENEKHECEFIRCLNQSLLVESKASKEPGPLVSKLEKAIASADNEIIRLEKELEETMKRLSS